MQSLNNQRLESSSLKTNEYQNNGRDKLSTGSYRVLRDEIVNTPSDILDYSVGEPPFLNRISASGEVSPSLTRGRVAEEVALHDPMSMPSGRSLKLQLR